MRCVGNIGIAAGYSVSPATRGHRFTSCSATSDCSRIGRREAGPSEQLWMLIRAPSHNRKTLSASNSGSLSPASRQSPVMRARARLLCSSMTRFAGCSLSGSSTAALAKAQPRSVSLNAPIWPSQARSWPLGSSGWSRAIVSQAASTSSESRRRHSATSRSFDSKMAVERHLVGAGRLGDGIDPDRMDAVAIEQLARRRQDALARRGGKLGGRAVLGGGAVPKINCAGSRLSC